MMLLPASSRVLPADLISIADLSRCIRHSVVHNCPLECNLHHKPPGRGPVDCTRPTHGGHIGLAGRKQTARHGSDQGDVR